MTESPDQIAAAYVARWQTLWNEQGTVSALYTDDCVLVGRFVEALDFASNMGAL